MILLRGVNHQYETRKQVIPVLTDINLTINKGEFVCVLGPSGCGKSTLLRIIAGIEQPTEGKVRMLDKPITGPGKDRGFVFQQPELFPWLSVSKNVQFGLRMQGKSRKERKQISDQFIKLVGLTDFANSFPYELSGGMKQRAAIARVLANDPSVMLMDEPFAALDAITKQHMQVSLRDIWKQTGKTILFITHDVEEALFLGTRILVLSARPGRIVKELESSLHLYSKNDSRSIRFSPEFITKRQELMKLIDHHVEKKREGKGSG